MISGSGGPDNNFTCETLYESVIVAIETLNAGTEIDTRSVNFHNYTITICELFGWMRGVVVTRWSRST